MSDRHYFQQRQRNRIYEAVVRAVEDHCARTGDRRKDIAARIGKSQASLSRLLSGPANWSLDTISDLLFAIRAELDVSVAPLDDRPTANRFHHLNGATATAPHGAPNPSRAAAGSSSAQVAWTINRGGTAR
ncbi:MAG TPA: helix-turn-helix transcriptional regulator [Beijerinckiaceae bacterium]|jgi:hypothetical protein